MSLLLNEFLIFVYQISNQINKTFMVVCIYRHTNYDLANRKSDYEFFRTLITSQKNSTLDFYILGDFNLPKPSHINPLNTLIEENSRSRLIKQPTRENNILDLIIVNNIQSIIACEVYHPFLSDHKMTSCIIHAKKPKIKTISITSRNYTKTSAENLTEFFQILPVVNDECADSSLQRLQLVKK